MSYYILKDLKIYKIEPNNYIMAYRGSDNNVRPKDYKTIELDIINGKLKTLKRVIKGFLGDRIRYNSLFNVRSDEDFVNLAIETIGSEEDFEKLNLFRVINNKDHPE
jgi:hypothetical protein